MTDYIQLISKDKKNYYLPKRIAYLSEYLKKEIEKVTTEKMVQIAFEDITFEILEVLVEYLNTKYYYEQMKELRPGNTDSYPIPENLSLDIVKRYL